MVKAPSAGPFSAQSVSMGLIIMEQAYFTPTIFGDQRILYFMRYQCIISLMGITGNVQDPDNGNPAIVDIMNDECVYLGGLNMK